MRLFQNAGVYPEYLRHFSREWVATQTFHDRLRAFLADRYGACHVLLPVTQGDPAAFFTNGDDEILQRAWARENGLRGDAPLDAILLAQVEAHRTEVFYNLDPMRYGDEFLKKLPGCVRSTIAWRAAPSSGASFGRHHLLVCNFPGIIASYRAQGWRAEYLAPSYDPQMEPFAARDARPVDVLFVGAYSRHHRRRSEILEAISALHDKHQVVFCLDSSRLTRVSESTLGRWLPLGKHRRPASIQRVARGPVFGRQLYEALSSAKIVVNGAVDMAGEDRGNMRCFETLGCGALMVSDRGRYPEGMVDGESMLAYGDPAEAVRLVERALADHTLCVNIARQGHDMLRTRYSKETQWQNFCGLVENL